jgi:hypothetical protein
MTCASVQHELPASTVDLSCSGTNGTDQGDPESMDEFKSFQIASLRADDFRSENESGG